MKFVHSGISYDQCLSENGIININNGYSYYLYKRFCSQIGKLRSLNSSFDPTFLAIPDIWVWSVRRRLSGRARNCNNWQNLRNSVRANKSIDQSINERTDDFSRKTDQVKKKKDLFSAYGSRRSYQPNKTSDYIHRSCKWISLRFFPIHSRERRGEGLEPR